MRSHTWSWRIATSLRAHDPNHLVSTSIQTDANDGSNARYRDYLSPVSCNPGGTLANTVDFLTPHSFVGVTASNQEMIRALRTAVPSKPIALEEIGWPTGLANQHPQFTEEGQATAINAMLAAARGDAATPGIAGLGFWMLVDFNDRPDDHHPEQPFFGLFWSEYTSRQTGVFGTFVAPWSRKSAANAVAHHFHAVWPD